jgi:hypothetical protein
VTERQSHAQQQWEEHEQGRSSVAERASMVRISAWTDELKRMQRWVAGLYKQHRQAEAYDKPITSPANGCM